VAVLAPGVAGPEGATLTLAPPVRLVGTYRETLPEVTFGALPAGGATGVLDGPTAPPPAPAPGGRSLQRLLTLLLLILAVVGFIVLNGGQ
jgi:hypothetical protein